MSLGSLFYLLWWVLDQLAQRFLFSDALFSENQKINCLSLPAKRGKKFSLGSSRFETLAGLVVLAARLQQ